MDSGDPKRRQYVRLESETKVLVKQSDQNEISEAKSVNLSSGGTFIRTDSPLPIGTSVEMTFEVPSRFMQVEAKGTVTWVIREQGEVVMGIEFTAIDPIAHYDLMRGAKEGGWLYAFGVLAEK